MEEDYPTGGPENIKVSVEREHLGNQKERKKYEVDHHSAPSHSEKPPVQTEEESIDGQSDSHCISLAELMKNCLNEPIDVVLEKYKYYTHKKKQEAHILKGRRQKITREQEMEKKYNDGCASLSSWASVKTDEVTVGQQSALQYKDFQKHIGENAKEMVHEQLENSELIVHPKEKPLPDDSRRKISTKKVKDNGVEYGSISNLLGIMGISKDGLQNLANTLEGDKDLNSPRELSDEAEKELALVEKTIQEAHVDRVNPELKCILVILPTRHSPTDILIQREDVILEWIFLPRKPNKKLKTYIEKISDLIHKGKLRLRQLTGMDPAEIVVPLTNEEVSSLWKDNEYWQRACSNFLGEINNHYPKSKRIEFIKKTEWVLPHIVRQKPISGVLTFYTDANKLGKAGYKSGDLSKVVQSPYNSVQKAELYAILMVLMDFTEPLNIVTDSQYAERVVLHIETAEFIPDITELTSLFIQLQEIIRNREHPIYITHIRSHTGLPGPLAQVILSEDPANDVDPTFRLHIQLGTSNTARTPPTDAIPLNLTNVHNQGTATLQHLHTRVPDRIHYQVEVDSSQPACTYCVLCLQFHLNVYRIISIGGAKGSKWKRFVPSVGQLGHRKTSNYKMALTSETKYENLIFDKDATTVKWKKESIFNKWCWHNWMATCRRLQIDPYLSPCTKLKSKWIKDLNINPVTLNLIEEKVGSTLERIGTGDHFLNITPTAQTLSATINQWDYMKLRSFCKAKDTITKTKHQPTEWEKIFTNPTSDRGLISRIYKELKKHDIKTSNSPIEKWAIEINREFTAEECRMAKRKGQTRYLLTHRWI
ncbi:hypothetical protein STEG23_023036 [Scotinomys teguina]